MSTKVTLLILTAGGTTRVVDLAHMSLPCVLGRDSELSQIPIADGQASRAHCNINAEGEHYFVEDLGSRNGTWLNDQRITKAELAGGDVLRLGSTKIRIEMRTEDDGDPMIGRTLGGFSFDSVLGHGRYGSVYRGTQTALSRPVAIKVLAAEYSKDPERVKAFLTEARRAGRLNHPNLVQVHDVCEVEDHYLLIMELMRCSAADLLRSRGVLKESVVLNVLLDTAKALAYAEAQKLVHRDVKPDNILMNEEEVYKLADLGIATPITDNGMAFQERTFGSPHYVAPEQAKGGSIDGRADLYALGASAWHMITGRTVFSGTGRQIVSSHINAELPELSQYAPNISDELEDLIYDLLEKNPEDRPANAQAVIKRVEEMRKNYRDESKRPPATHAPRMRRVRRRRR